MGVTGATPTFKWNAGHTSSTRGEIYASSMTFGAVCPSLQTTWLTYELKVIKQLLIMLPIINQRILNRLIIDISINWSQP